MNDGGFYLLQENASEYQIFPLPDSSECNKLLATKAINFRLIMFLLSKWRCISTMGFVQFDNSLR